MWLCKWCDIIDIPYQCNNNNPVCTMQKKSMTALSIQCKDTILIPSPHNLALCIVQWLAKPASSHSLYSSETLIHLSIKPWLAFWIKLTSLSFISGSQLLLKLCKRWCKIKAVICMLEITWAKWPTLVQILHNNGFRCVCDCCNRQRKLQASSLEQCSIRNVISDGYGWFLEPLQKRSCKAHWG